MSATSPSPELLASADADTAECSLQYCENRKFGACGGCHQDLCAPCMLGCMRVFKHPDEDEAPGAALMFICPLCRAPCVTAQRFEDLAKNGKCDVKELMGVTNTRELSVRKYCGDECDCVTVDIHLTHLPCGEGCYTCFASTIEYRLEMSATSPDLLRRAATTIQTTDRKMLAAKQCMIKFIIKRLDGGVLSTECWTTHQLRDLLVRMENIRGDTEAPHQAVDDCPHCTDCLLSITNSVLHYYRSL